MEKDHPMRDFIHSCLYDEGMSQDEIEAFLEHGGMNHDKATEIVQEQINSFLKEKKERGWNKIALGIFMLIVFPIILVVLWSLCFSSKMEITNPRLFIVPLIIMIWGIYYIEKGKEDINEANDGDL